ncbi:MAG TPA: outer membrane lipoprotein-sorting protein [Candidatus Bathyarchaeia archaeon]|nr:outer membrane lipoprotein-sorting protein [Candidatus Bathyarchaeia archaeon]
MRAAKTIGRAGCIRTSSTALARVLSFVLVLAPAVPSRADSSPASGDDVIARARANTATMVDKTMRVSMRIVGPSGDERARSLKGFEKKGADGRKVLWVFEAPAELAGTSFLAVERRDGPDLLWVYFPGIRRVRQVPEQLRRERFQGSHFTYEDLTTIFYFDYGGTHALEGQKACATTTCFVVATTLKEGRFAYSRLVSWIRSDTYLPDHVEFYDKDLVKVMRVLGSDTIQGIPTILKMEMDGVADGYHTGVEFTEVRYNGGLADDLFTPNYLASTGK